MQPRVKIGVIVGIIGLVLSTCLSGVMSFLGFCGPIVSLIAGGIAGSLAVRQENPSTKNEGARAGGIAGGIAGGLIILGQLLGTIGLFLYLQSTGTPIDITLAPDVSGNPIGYYAGGIAITLGLGIVGALLAAGAGAGLGYLVTLEHPMTPPSQDIIS